MPNPNTLNAMVAGAKQAVAGPGSDLKSPEVTRARYTAEREKRLRPNGDSQYFDLAQRDNPWFKKFADDACLDLSAPYIEALRVGDHCKYIVCGAGFGGLLAAIRLIQAGINVDDTRMIDSAGGYSGTWY